MIEYWKNLSLESLFYINDEGLVCQEEWVNLDEYKIYYISNLGRLKSMFYVKKYNKILCKIIKQQQCDKGYLRYCFYKKGKSKTIKIHRLVALAFIPNPLNLPQVNHIGKYPDGREGNKSDNRAISLKWCTSKENINHSWENGLSKPLLGEKNYASKLKNNEILQIRKMISKGFKKTDIALKFNVSRKVIYNIEYNISWKHL